MSLAKSPGALATARAENCGVVSHPTPSTIADLPRPPQERIALRDYQERGVAEIRVAFKSGASRICYCLPTGGGKTFQLASIVACAAARGNSVLLLAPRIELVERIGAALARRVDRWCDWFDLIIVSEAHHSVAGSWRAILASQPCAKALGVTATLERLDGRGLGAQFNVLVQGPSIAELTAILWLYEFVIYAPAAAPANLVGLQLRAGDFAAEDLRDRMDGVVINAAVTEYLRICPGSRVIVCVDITHSRAVVAAFFAAGVTAAHVDGVWPRKSRRETFAAFARGEISIISNVELFSEGIDIPDVDGVTRLRPTQSLALYLQQLGRALRPAPGKEKAPILDFAGNSLRHGLPDAPRQSALDARPRSQRERSAAPAAHHCKECGAVNVPHMHECANCGANLGTPAERREIAMRLEVARRDPLVERIRGMNYPARLRWAGEDLDRLTAVQHARGYWIGWVRCPLRELGKRAA